MCFVWSIAHWNFKVYLDFFKKPLTVTTKTIGNSSIAHNQPYCNHIIVSAQWYSPIHNSLPFFSELTTVGNYETGCIRKAFIIFYILNSLSDNIHFIIPHRNPVHLQETVGTSVTDCRTQWKGVQNKTNDKPFLKWEVSRAKQYFFSGIIPPWTLVVWSTFFQLHKLETISKRVDKYIFVEVSILYCLKLVSLGKLEVNSRVAAIHYPGRQDRGQHTKSWRS